MNAKTVRIATAGTILALVATALPLITRTDARNMENRIAAGDTQALAQMQSVMGEGNAVAQNWLGLHFLASHDDATAAHWFLKAADQGDVMAQHNLADLYASGRGVPFNPVVAYALYSLVSASTQRWVRSDAQASLQQLAASLSTEQIEAGQDVALKMRREGISNTLEKIEQIENDDDADS